MKAVFAMANTFARVWTTRHLGATPSVIPFVYLDITDRCNSRCRSCSIWRPREPGPAELTTEEILGLVPSLRALRTQIVSIGGGEPLLRTDLETCVSAFREAGCAVHMNTNALAIDEARATSLTEAGLSVAYISCDHPDPDGYREVRGVDGLDRVVSAIAHFQSGPKAIPVGINMVVSRLNQDAIERMAERCIEWGVVKAQFIPVHGLLRHRSIDRRSIEPLLPQTKDLPTIKAALRRATRRLRHSGIETNSEYFIDLFERAYEPVRTIPCMAGSLFVMINPFGDVVPCYQYGGRLSIRGMPLEEIVRSEAFRKQRHCVAECSIACWDSGSAEPSIRFHLPYLLRHPIQIYQEARLHLG
ncbi:MAG: radical SAM protein [Phycisphaerae bacterium]|nr:radical SAM protein [Phycisphaerae bacterium]